MPLSPIQICEKKNKQMIPANTTCASMSLASLRGTVMVTVVRETQKQYNATHVLLNLLKNKSVSTKYLI